MKWKAEQMALRILKFNLECKNKTKCAMGFDNAGRVILYCDYPERLHIPNDHDEQWYLTENGFITNKGSTAETMKEYDSIVVKSFA